MLNTIMSQYQTHFSDKGKEICKQLDSNGFIEELDNVLVTQLFSEFVSCPDNDEVLAVKAKLDVKNMVINLLRNGKY
jgi:hypothetical protein